MEQAKPSPVDLVQSRLIIVAGVFLFLYSLALTLTPAAQAGNWSADYRWEHWFGFLSWVVMIAFANHQTARSLPGRDPYLLPVAALLTGWGVMTIWRLLPFFGLRQSIWIIIVVLILSLGVRLPANLDFLRRYKYLWLIAGLVLTALTLIFGTNPLGGGPRMWLGCCGIYFQPSEPLKLLLIVYICAYLAERLPQQGHRAAKPADRPPLLPLLAPTLFMTGLALLLLIVQRDLGTASIFIFLYTAIVYVASGRRRVLLAGAGTVVLAGVMGFALFDVVRERVNAWANPWHDPSGQSYQIVQSLTAIANGGMFGQGAGMGNPTPVPISHSDFIFVSIVEESGILGGFALVVLIGLLLNRGIRIALGAETTFTSYLAAGLTAYLVGQSILIIGGNIRLLPLTGVTLPMVSYGGSSLVTTWICVLLLMLTSSRDSQQQPGKLHPAVPYLYLAGFFLIALLAISALLIWWQLSPAAPAPA